MNIFEFHALSVYLQRNLWHIFSINTLNGETIFTCQLWNHPRNTWKNLKDDFETMVKPWLGRDIHGWKPCWLKANLPAEVGGTLSSPPKTPASGHFLVPEFDRFFWYSKCCFLFKATHALCFFQILTELGNIRAWGSVRALNKNWELYIVRGSAQEDKESPSHHQDDELKHRVRLPKSHPKVSQDTPTPIPFKCLFSSELHRVYESKLVASL